MSLIRFMIVIIILSLSMDLIFDRKYYPKHEGARTELINKIRRKKK